MRLLLAPALLLALAAPTSNVRAACPPIELLYDENENLSEKHTDVNRDCTFDEFVYYVDGKPERGEKDTDESQLHGHCSAG